MARERGNGRAGIAIPKPPCAVAGDGRDDLAVAREGRIAHAFRMSSKSRDLHAGLNVPELGGVVARGGQHVLAVRAENGTPQIACMTLEREARIGKLEALCIGLCRLSSGGMRSD